MLQMAEMRLFQMSRAGKWQSKYVYVSYYSHGGSNANDAKNKLPKKKDCHKAYADCARPSTNPSQPSDLGRVSDSVEARQCRQCTLRCRGGYVPQMLQQCWCSHRSAQQTWSRRSAVSQSR